MANIEKEIWKDVTGYEGLYQVSSFGNVRSLERYVWSNNQWGKYLRYCPAKKLKNVLHPNGYYRVDLCGKLYSNHHLVAIAFISCKPEKKEVNHKDGNKLNNHFLNLEWVTKSENIRHADRTGLRVMPKGESHYYQRIGHPKSRLIIDTSTGIYFDSLKHACDALCLKYRNILYQISVESKLTTLRYA